MQVDSLDHHALRALLEWQVELGVTEAIAEAPINRYEMPKAAPKPRGATAPPAVAPPAPAPAVAADMPQADAVDAASRAAGAAPDLPALAAALAAFDLCDLKRGARNTVFADGNPAARVMIIGEAPGRDEDLQGKPFVGRAGQLLDRMFDCIGLGRQAPDPLTAIYITNVLPWRPPQNRDPTAEEIGLMMPFVARHVELADPDVIVPMGNISSMALLGRRGITKLRGRWTQALGRPALPMFHPAYLLRNPPAKRAAWEDLLILQARLRDMS